MTILDPSRAMRETITVKRTTSQTTGGDPVRGTTFLCAARVERDWQDLTAGSTGASRYGGRVLTVTEVMLGDLIFFSEDDPSVLNTGHAVVEVKRRVAFDGSVTQYSASF